KVEIEESLRRYGADQFVSGWESGRAMIGFRCQSRFVRFELKFPDANDEKFRHTASGRWRYPGTRSDRLASEAYDQEVRRLWRALALVIKAKREAVQSGITTFEHEFMAHIVMPDGKTVGQHVSPAIAEAYRTGTVRGLLPEFTE